MQFMPLTSCQANTPRDQKSCSDAGVGISGEESASSSENEARGFVPYKKARKLKVPAEGTQLCL